MKIIINSILSFLLICIILGNQVIAEETDTVEINKSDYLMLLIGNYVHQFNIFDMSVHVWGNQIRINIYYDVLKQDRKRAENFKERISGKIPSILSNFDWAKDYTFEILVNSEDMESQYR